MTEWMALVGRLRRQIESIDPYAGGDDIDDGLGGIGEDGDGTGQPIGQVFDEQQRETEDHDDLLEFEVVVRHF